MGKIQTLWRPIIDIFIKKLVWEKKKLAILGVKSKKLKLLPMK
jgi:hypothetical protein